MDTIQYHDEEFRQLFQQIPLEKPSADFTERVMAQVNFEQHHAIHLKRIRLIALAVSIPCIAALLLVVGFFTRNYWETYLWTNFEPLFISLKNTILSTTELFTGNGSRIFLPGLLFLALLLGDLFFRRYLERKKQIVCH